MRMLPLYFFEQKFSSNSQVSADRVRSGIAKKTAGGHPRGQVNRSSRTPHPLQVHLMQKGIIFH